MKTKLILVFFIGVLSWSDLAAQATVTSVGSGLWSNPLIWDAGVPAPGDNVIIASGDVVSADAAATPITCNWMEIYGTLVVDNGVTLTVTGSDAGNVVGENFTIDGAAPGTVTNNGTFVLDEGAGFGALYSDQGGTFTNNNIFTLDNGGTFASSGAFTNAATFNIDNGAVFQANGTLLNTGGTIGVTSTTGNSSFEIYVPIDNTGGVININSASTMVNIGSFTAVGTINMNAGGTYNHAQNAGTIPACTWNVTSTCLVSGNTGLVAPGGLGQTFGNFTWSSSQTVLGSLNLAGALTTVNGDFTLTETGANKTLFLSSAVYTLNIGGNLLISANGTDALQFATSGSPTVNVGGNVSITAGRLVMGASAAAANAVLNITGNYVHSATAGGNVLSMSGGAGTTGTMNLTGNFDYSSTSASLITETAAGTGVINFVGDVTHTFNTASLTPFVNKIQIVITGNDVLDMSASTANLTLQSATGVNVNSFTVNGTGTLITGTKTITANLNTTPAVFTLSSGATLNTTNVSGVNATILGAGTKTLDNAANYILGNASTSTGLSGINGTNAMNDLTTTASAVLDANIIAGGALLHSTGTFSSSGFTISAATLTNNATFTAGASAITTTGAFTNTGTFNANTSVLTIGGNFSNGGTFTANTGTVAFNGSAAQTIGGASITTFYNINSDNTCVACGVSLAQDANLTGALTINSRTFTTTGFNFKLVSDVSGTACIGPITVAGADFVGNIIMERYTGSSTATDWRLLGFPTSGASFADWADDIYTTGFTGSDDPGESFVSIQWYDEGVYDVLDSGFTPIVDVGDYSSINGGTGTGYWVYVGPSPVTYSVTGAPNKFSQTLAAQFTAQFSDEDDGWSLVSNPYPCTIDWDDADWTAKDAINDAIYIYNSSTGTYAYHCPSDSAPIDGNGGSQYIASQQAFWVKANSLTTPSLIAAEGVKITSQNPELLRTTRTPNTSNYPSAFKDFPVPLSTNNTPGRLKLVSSGSGVDDEIFVHFKQGATNNFDGKYDAWKMINPNPWVQNFSSVMNGTDLAVNGLPSLTADVHIPLRLTIPVGSGVATYSIRRDSILMLPTTSCIILEDKATTSMIDLRSVITYTFTISDTTVLPRFVLHIYAPIAKKAINATCSADNNGMAIAKGTGTGPWDYLWKNSAGTTVKTTIASASADTLFNCAAGTYSVSVSSAVCGAVTDTIIVKAPAALVNAVSQTDVSCFGKNNGSATVSPVGGTPSYSYLWDNGQTTSAAVNLPMGDYSVTVTDAGGCTITATVSVSQPTQLSNSVSQTNVSCFGMNDGSVSISASGGSPVYSYLWDSGQTTSAAVNLPMGDYSATVTDAAGCTITATVSVSQPTQLSNSVSQINVSCFGMNDGLASVAATGGTPFYSYLWDNGQTTSAAVNLTFGDYAATITDANGCVTTNTVTIAQPPVLVAGFSASTYTVDIAIDSNVTFANSSSGASSYQWNFGDTSGIDISANPVHAYTFTGTYTVTLVSSDNNCSDTTYKTIVVVNSNPTVLNENYISSSVNVVYDNGEVFLQFSFVQENRINISVFNIIGEEILSQNNLLVKNERIKLDFPSTSAGMYLVRMDFFGVSEMKNEEVSKKIIIPVR